MEIEIEAKNQTYYGKEKESKNDIKNYEKETIKRIVMHNHDFHHARGMWK